MRLISILILCFILLFASVCFAADAWFQWNPVTTVGDPPIGPIYNLQGYKFYCGNSPGVYTIVKDIFMIQPELDGKNYYKIADVVQTDGLYYCAVAAYNPIGESGKSNEIFFVLRGGILDLSLPSHPTNLSIILR
jgi:hypothetical protein